MDKTLEQPLEKRAVIYIRIPFGTARLPHAPRPMDGPLFADSETKHRYMQALRREVASALPLLEEYSVPAIHVGGGSPSSVRPDDVSALLRGVRAGVNLERGFELSMQVAPQTVGTPCMDGMKVGGVNRVSLRVPSADDDELERLGCGFTRETVEHAVEFLARFNFRTIGFDVACGLPGQDERSLRTTLKVATFYEPEHVRVLRWGAGDGGARTAPGEGADGLLGQARDFLAGAGYRAYASGGSLRYAKPGYESAYAKGLLSGDCDVFGFGLGAVSFMGGVRCENTADLATYIENSASFDKIVAKAERLTDEQLAQRRARLRGMLV